MQIQLPQILFIKKEFYTWDEIMVIRKQVPLDSTGHTPRPSPQDSALGCHDIRQSHHRLAREIHAYSCRENSIVSLLQ
jgi:hypothetical protein